MNGWTEILTTLVSRSHLRPEQIRWVMEEMMQGRAGEAETAAFLMGMRGKGENAAEIGEAARVLRSHMLGWDAGSLGVLDTCGTGGDASGTFNISTATALVVAGAGVPVVKHGNRSVSSRSGSADALAALGVPLEASCEGAERSLRETGLAFCFAPHFHPALRHVAAVRKKLGIPTMFNWLGPLANPAGARRQLLGVGRAELLDLLAEALVHLGVEHALVVHGGDGLDEVSLGGTTHVREVRGDAIKTVQWEPQDFGLEPVRLAEVRVSSPEESAALILQVLRGTEGPALRLVLANAAAALLVAGKVNALPEGVAIARHAIVSGNALAVLAKLGGRTTGPGISRSPF